MAREFVRLNDKDCPELRNKLGLPVYKTIRYMKKSGYNAWDEIMVSSFEIIDTYMPSGTSSIMVTLETGEKIRILQDYFSEMNKSSFVENMKKLISEE